MKPLKFWSMLILIASALLLSAESPSTKPNPSPLGKPNEGAGLVQQPAQNYPLPIVVTGTPDAPEQTPTPNKSGDGGQGDSNAMIFLTAVMAGATFFIALFNWQLVGVTDEMKTAAKAAADAAEAALHVDRPFLLVTGVECTDTKFINGILTHKFAIHLKNFGVGPADIATYIAGADPLDAPYSFTTGETKEPALTYVPERGSRLSDSLVGPGDEANDRIKCESILDHQLFALLQDGTKTLGVNGIVTYRGGAPKIYETKFFWWFYIDADGRPVRYVRAARFDLNSHT
jgi:hypothetical protein